MAVDLRTTDALKDLIKVLHDSEENFRKAAGRAESIDLNRILLDFAAQRGRMAGVLHAEVKRLGEPDQPNTGGPKGSLHLPLIRLRAARVSDRDRTLLEECGRSEDAVILKYQDVLGSELPLYVREMLEEQLEEIGTSRARLRDFSTARHVRPQILRTSRQSVGPILITNWWSLVIRGVVALTVGAVVFNSPGNAIEALVELFAIYALVDGLVAFAGAMRAVEARQRSWPLAIEGVTGIVAGFIALSSPVYDLSPVYLIAAWAVTTGLLEIVAGLQLRRHLAGEWLLMASGFSSIVLGILAVVAPLSTLSFWVGAYALLFGALFVVLGLRLRPLLRKETTGSRL